ncbi:MAG: peptidylprolyl isomerase [Phenylobacterium sp.]|nr:peptidylprolyl isomerase [Phenylobacterium sp.]MBP7650692.1 peptidylprolyl isomerase [Phenylobacterium sp.]
MIRKLTAALFAFGLMGAAPAPDWRPLDPENLLVIDTTKGRIIVEMAPSMAPQAVARVKLLAREGVYDGLQFHRVIEGFVNQTGNPNNRDGGVSRHPDLPLEATFKLEIAGYRAVAAPSDGTVGFLGAVPIATVSGQEALRSKDGTIRAWGAYCPGVAGMGRQAAETTANSEIFFMRGSSRRLDRDYTVWGRIVVGGDVNGLIAVGEPPAAPDRMLKVRVAADMPAAERPRLSIRNPESPAFRTLVRQTRMAKGADFSICDLEVPVRVEP